MSLYVCTNCQKRPASIGRKWCEECRARERAKCRRKTERRRASGKCTHCGADPLPGKLSCVKCFGRDGRRGPGPRQDVRDRQLAYKELGFCQCGNTRAPNRLSCVRCLSYIRA